MKYSKKTDTLTFNLGEKFDRTIKDKDGFEHRLWSDKKYIHHESNRPWCVPCKRFKEIVKTDNSYTEICPNCGQGSGSMSHNCSLRQ